MSFSHDRRGQSVVVGTVILFGFLILALSLYQVQFVPAENEEIEFEHSQQVEGEFLDLRNAVLQAGSTGSAQSTRIQLGERYPQRTFFLNPPPAAGTLQTTDTAQVRIENVTVVGDGNAARYWNDTDNNLTFDTRSLRYQPSYNEYRGSPRLVYEHSAVVAEFDDGTPLLRSNPTIVTGESGSDSRISLTVLNGSVSANGVDARNVDISPVSQGRGSVQIAPDSGVSRIVLPTAVENETALAERWNRTTDATVTAVPGEDRIQIALNGNYALSLSEVSIDGSGTTQPAYIVPVGNQNVTAGQSVGVEVRDKYNNPVQGATVVIDDAPNRTTNDDGQVFFDPGSDDSTASINGSVSPGKPDYESVKFTVSAGGGGGGGENGTINPVGRDNRVVLANVTVGGSGPVELTFRNEADEEIEFNEIGYNLYYDGGKIQDSFTTDGGTTVGLRDGFENFGPIEFSGQGATQTVTLSFDKNPKGSLIGVTIIDDDGRRTLYITGVPN